MTTIALGYQTTPHPDVVARPLDRNGTDHRFHEVALYCRCGTTAIGVMRHTRTGHRELWCGAAWHQDLAAFVGRAEDSDRYWANLRAEDDAVIAANPDSDYARDLAARWAAMVRQPAMPD